MNAKRGAVLIPTVFVLAWAWFAFYDCSTAAADYSFYLDRFEVSGQVSVSDEFDDGEVSPWVIYDPTVEESDGFVSFSNPGTVEEGALDGVNYVTEMSFIGSGYPSGFVVENGGGDFTGISKWSPVVPGVNQWYEMEVGYEVQQEPHLGIDISVGVGNWDSEFAAIMGIEPGIGISFYRSTDSLLWRHIPINEADLTSADGILLKLDFYDDTDEFRAGFSLDDGETYQYFPELIGWDQDTPGHYEWYFSGQTIELQSPADFLDIERIGIMTECEYVDGIPNGPYPWDFEIEVLVSDPGELHHINVTNPPGALIESETIFETEPNLWAFDPDKDASLSDLRQKYPEGIYILEFCDSDNSVLRIVFIDYSGLLPPASPVDFIYPPSDGQTGVSTNPTFTWNIDPEAGDILARGIDDEVTGELVYGGLVPMTTLSWSPGSLLPNHDYHLDVTVSNIKDWAGPDDLPTTVVDDDEFTYYLTFDNINTISFTTVDIPPEDAVDIDLIWFKTENNYAAGTPESEPYDIGALVFGSNLNSVKVTSPADVTEYLEEGPGYWYWDREEKYASLDDLYDEFPPGPYLFVFNEGEINEDTATVLVGPEEPTGFGNIQYPADGAINVELSPTFLWDSCLGYGDILFVSVGDVMADEDIFMDELNINETSWTPGLLPEERLCSFGVSVQTRNEVSGTTNNGDTFNFRDVGQWSNGITFTTVPPPSTDPVEEIEEILDLVDESVEDGTLTGEGPGNSADNRLNALRNKLEDVRRQIEAGRYEDACDQLWSTYRKCDGESRPPDFVTGDAAEDLADMILLLMDDLGC